MHQAGLMMHELLYRIAIKNGATTSRKIRYFNSLIFSERFKLLNEADYKQLLISLGLHKKDNGL
jgi:hypothetical protein